MPPSRHALEAGARAVISKLFPHQIQAAKDPARRKVIWTTRRAGKTFTVVADMMARGLLAPNSYQVYIGKTFSSAEGIAWPILKRLDRECKLGCRFQEQKLRVVLPGGAWIQLFGADRPGFHTKLYGLELLSAAVDEAAFYTVDLRDLVDDVLAPTLIGQRGTLYLMSIPGTIPTGLFYDLTHTFDYQETFSGRPAAKDERYSVHSWTTADNPHMAVQFAEEIEQIAKANPEFMEDPRTLRNYFKAWVQELGESVYRFSWDRQTSPLSAWTPRPDDHYVMGLDTGWSDAKAISLNVYRDDTTELTEILSWKKSFMLLAEFAEHIRAIMDDYKPGPDGSFSIVGDAKMEIFEELRRAHNIPVMEAEKADKRGWIEIWNSEAASGRIQIIAPDRSPHVEEMGKLVKRYKPDGIWTEQPGQPNDCCDAHLMAFRHARHYLRGEEEPVLVPTATDLRLQEHKQMVDAYLASQNEDRWSDF